MGKSQQSVKEFAMVGFMLLAVLFGMQIMAFIFGNLNVVSDSIDDVRATVSNETGAYLNASGYTVVVASNSNFSGGVIITEVFNSTPAAFIQSGNYTVVAASGVVTNASESDFSTGNFAVNISYTYNHKTAAKQITEGVNNNSLQAIGNYAVQAGTQFTTLGVAITLVVLVAVFLFFWAAFIGGGSRKGKESGAAAGAGAFN